MKCLLFFMAFLVWTVPGYGQSVYYTDKLGSNTNSCATATSTTRSNAKLSIESAMSCLSGADTLIIGGGTYDEELNNLVPSGTSSSAMTTIRNRDTEVVTITKTGSCGSARIVTQSNRSFIRWFGNGTVAYGANRDGQSITETFVIDSGVCPMGFDADEDVGLNTFFELNGISIHGNEAASSCMFLSGHDHRFANGVVRDCGQDESAGFDHGLYISGDRAIVENSFFINIHGWGVHLYDGRPEEEGQYDSSDNHVRANLFVDIDTQGGVIFGTANRNQRNQAYNNRFVRVNGSWGCMRSMYGSGNKFLNNSCFDSVSGVRFDPSGAGMVARNNILYMIDDADGIDDQAIGSSIGSNLTADPSFVNSGINDLRILVGSAAENTGEVRAEFTDDAFGVARPQPVGDDWDIGAHERIDPPEEPGGAITITFAGGDIQRPATVPIFFELDGITSGILTLMGSCNGAAYVPMDVTFAYNAPSPYSWSVNAPTCASFLLRLDQGATMSNVSAAANIIGSQLR